VQFYRPVVPKGKAVQRDEFNDRLFNDRLDAVRNKFASSLESRIDGFYAELPQLSGVGTSAVEAVVSVYRGVHAICGIAGSVGFPETGREAKKVEDALIEAYRGQRALAAVELTHVDEALGVLTAVAQKELSRVSAAASSANAG
jgi:HPt (histidine-containing phosphotransfer) domain-containing protein